MTISKFEDILAWKKAKDLVIHIYSVMKFSKDYSFKDQLQRATISIMNNIAEGFERKGDKEFKHYLYIAKGSCGETRSMLYVALELHYISQADFQKLINLTIEISKMLSGFIKSLN